jgi:hypothetical protein
MTCRDRERPAGAQLTARALHCTSRAWRSDDGWGVGGRRPDALASVTRRLYDDYHEQATLGEVVSTVSRCRSELDIVVDASLPEMVERLARQRLTDRRAASQEGPSA